MKTQILVTACACLAALALILSSLALNARFAAGNKYKQEQSSALRTVLCYFEGLTLSQPNLDATRRKRALDAYNHALFLIHAAPCRF